MKRRQDMAATVFAAIGTGILILDSRTAVTGATEGIRMCLQTIIPSLFPFFVLSALLTTGLAGRSIPILRPLEQLLGIPRGSSPLFLIGILGGYPVGAQNICQAYENGSLQIQDARRMLGFCNNAGPSFIFGMCSGLFTSSMIPWVLWCIQILSAVITGCILPGRSNQPVVLPKKQITLPQALNQSLRTMAQVCGWVVLFRVTIAFLERWIYFFMTPLVQIMLTGILELSNGCISLKQLPVQGMRYLLCTLFLSLGGVCVGLQTVSVTQSIGTGRYFPGKLLHTALCLLFSIFLQPVLFYAEDCAALTPWAVPYLLCIITAISAILRNPKNRGSILKSVPV